VKLNGVYSVMAGLSPAVSLSTPKVTITQKTGATVLGTKILDGAMQPGNRYVDFGTVTLPLVPVADENDSVNYTFTFTPSSASWGELLILNVNGNIVWCSDMTAANNIWIDAPNIATGIGMVWAGSLADKTDAKSIMDKIVMSGGPLQVKAPISRVLVYSTTSAPGIQLRYKPHWLTEPTS